AIDILCHQEEGYRMKTHLDGEYMVIATQAQAEAATDSVQPLQLRSLYTMAGMQFVIPEPMIRGIYGIVKVPEEEIDLTTLDALVVSISANGETRQVELLGGAGTSNFSEKLPIGGLDFSLAYGSKVYELPFAIELNDFIAEKYPGTEMGYRSEGQ